MPPGYHIPIAPRSARHTQIWPAAVRLAIPRCPVRPGLALGQPGPSHAFPLVLLFLSAPASTTSSARPLEPRLVERASALSSTAEELSSPEAYAPPRATRSSRTTRGSGRRRMPPGEDTLTRSDLRASERRRAAEEADDEEPVGPSRPKGLSRDKRWNPQEGDPELSRGCSNLAVDF